MDVNKSLMNKENENKIKALISLLEDDDEDIVSNAMERLLSIGCEIAPFIAAEQDSENQLLRKRIHQILSIINIRDLRNNFASKINQGKTDLWESICESHLLWYERDNIQFLNNKYDLLSSNFSEKGDFSIQNLAAFMKENGFVTSIPGDLEADFYCIGKVLDTKIGADSILCAIAIKLAKDAGIKLNIGFNGRIFYIFSENGIVIKPNDWKLRPNRGQFCKALDTETVIKNIIYKIYVCAVASDSYRYIYTIGNVLTQIESSNKLVTLPYPFKVDKKNK